MEKNWLRAFGNMTYGIYVLTTVHGDTINGMIASWVTQVSYAPPLILTAVHPNRYSHELIAKSNCFALHVVERAQTEILGRMKGSDPMAKFAGLDWEPGQTGSPILKGCMAWMECRVVDHYQPGNHTLFIGQVIDAQVQSTGTPMCTLDYKGTYIGDV